ncbi:MAG: hypothetical protein L0Y72_05190 [Gemmataceae bacterium]|nr:hypothetical protein [Gemmataceae bacterium]MCI0738417.1 hypothetical protein [Gemmataceae bacterium]
MDILRPTELADHFAYMLAYAPDNYPQEFGRYTNADAFGDAFRAVRLFRDSAKTEEGKERLTECERHLHVCFEYYEHGDTVTAFLCLQEVMEMFRKFRRYISISDE